jgi:hypothetical protein
VALGMAMDWPDGPQAESSSTSASTLAQPPRNLFMATPLRVFLPNTLFP